MNWLFTDMDSFFASVEQALRPELRGRPVGVIPVESRGTCVIAASYDAKRQGVKVGTSVREARRLCPGIVLVKARPSLYVQVHRRILHSVEQCAPIERVYSIDEWSVRLRGEYRQAAEAKVLGGQIKQQLLRDFGPWLTCSVGIAATRLLAKIASGLQKPDGLTVLPTSELPQRLEHLALQDLCGISEGIFARLKRHGVHTTLQLWELSQEQAARIWGSVVGAEWWAGFHGEDLPEVPTRRRSMSHGNVLEPRLRHEEGARGILLRLTCKLAQRLRRHEFYARSMSIYVSDQQRQRFKARLDFPCANDTPTLIRLFLKLWDQRPPRDAPIIKVNVSVSGLVHASQVAAPLFEEIRKLERLSRSMDQINYRFGLQTVYFAPLHAFRHEMENKIAFGRIPEELD